MSGNTDQKHLDDPMKSPPENSPDQTIPAKDISAIKTNQEPENMEVHHHPHLHHKPKKWREYFLEFQIAIMQIVTASFDLM